MPMPSMVKPNVFGRESWDGRELLQKNKLNCLCWLTTWVMQCIASAMTSTHLVAGFTILPLQEIFR